MGRLLFTHLETSSAKFQLDISHISKYDIDILIRKSALLSTLSKKHLRVCEILKSLCTVDEVSQHSTFAAENRRDCTVLKRCENDPKPQPPGTIWKFVGLKINSRHMHMWFSFAFTGSRLYSRKTNPKNLKSAVL